MKSRPNPFLRSASLAASIVLCFAASAKAGSLTWDGSDTVTSGAQGGNGTWDANTTLNWWNGTADVVWPNSGTDNDAIFAGTAGTVTIASGGVTVNDMLFTTTGYILSGAGTITLNGTTPTITLGSGISATIGNNTATILDGTAGLTKAGAGTLTLNGTTANSFTGGLNIKGGTLALDFSNFGGSTPFNNLVASTNALTLGGGVLSITGKGTAASTSSQTFASTTVNAGNSALTLTNGAGATSVTANLGPVTLNQGGVLILTNAPSATQIYNISAGGNVTVPASTTYARAGLMYGTGTSTRWAQIDSSGKLATMPSSTGWVTSGASASTVYNAGTTTQDLAGDQSMYGILSNATSSLPVHNLGSTTTAYTLTTNGIININTGLLTLQQKATIGGTLQIGAEKDLVINAANSGGVTISAPIINNGANASSVTINSTSTGVTTLSGANTFSGGVYMNAGTLTLGVGSVGSVGSITSGALGKGTLTLSGGVINTGAFTHMNAINVTAGTTTNVFGAGTLTGPITGTGTFSNDSTVGGGSASLLMQGDISAFQGTFNFNNTTLNRNNFNFNATTGNALDGSQARFVVNGVITGSNIRQLTLGGAGAGTIFKVGELSGTGGQVQSGGGTIEIGYLNTDSAFTGQIVPGAGGTKITKVGSGTLTLGGANTYTGVTTVNAGILKAGSTTAFGPAANASLAFGASSTGKVQLNGNSMTVVGLNTNATPGTPILENANAAGATLTVNNTATSSYAGALQDGTGGGALNLIKSAAGTLTLSGSNSYTGTTAVSGGTLAVTKAGALAGYSVGSKVSVANTATLALNYGVGSSDWTQTQVSDLLTNNGAGFAAGSTLAFDTTNGSGSYGLNMPSASFGLTKLGTNMLTLSGNNGYTGATAVNAGTLQSTKAGALANSISVGVNNAGSMLAINYGGASDYSAAEVVTLLGKTTFGATTTAFGFDTTNAASAVTYGNTLNLAAGVTKLGSGTLILNQANTYTGITTINAGTLSANTIADATGSSIGLSALANAVTFGGGTLNFTGTTGATQRTFAFNAGGGTFDIAGGSTLSLNSLNTATSTTVANWTGTGGVTKTGNGTLEVGNNRSGSGDRFLVGSTTGGDFNMSGGALNIKSNRYFVIAEGASATGAYNQTAGTVNYSPVNGNVTGNDVYITNSASSAVASMNVSGGSFTVNGSNLKIKVAAIGTGSLSVGGGAGTATVTTPKIEMSTAATSISTVNLLANGTLEVGNPINELTAGGSSTLNFDGGTLKATAASADFINVDNIYVKAGGGKFNTNGNAITIDNALQQFGATTGAFEKTGGGTLTLSNTNTYTGLTTVSDGTLALSSAGAVNTSSGITVNGSGAKFLQTSSVAVSPAVALTQGTLTGSGTVTTVNVGAGTGGVISNNDGVGGAALTIGTLTLAGGANINLYSNGASTAADLTVTTLTNNSAANAVTLTANNTTGWSNGSTYNLIGYTTLNGSGANNFAHSVNNLSARQSAAWGDTGSAITLAISGDNPRWMGDGDGKWNLASTSNWKLVTGGGYTTFLAADDVLFDDNATGTASIDIDAANVTTNTTVFNNSTAKSYTLGSTGGFGISTGSLTKSNTGSVTINTANTYTGTTTISNGTLSASSIVVSAGASNLGNATSAVILGDATNEGTLSYTGNTDIYTRGFTLNAGGGQVDVTTSGQTLTVGTGGISNTSGGLLTIGGDGNTIISSVIGGGAGGVTKTGNGTLTLSNAANTYTGATNINGGTLSIGADLNLGTAPTGATAGKIGFNGGTLSLSAAFSISGNRGIALSGSGALLNTATGLATYTGIIAGSGPLTLNSNNGTGDRWSFGNVASNYSGNTILSGAGTIVIQADSTGSATTANLTAGAFGTGTVSLNGAGMRSTTGAAKTIGNAITIDADTTFATLGSEKSLTFSGPVTLTGNRILTANTGATVTTQSLAFSGAIGQDVAGRSLTQAGSGKLFLSGNNTYSGGTYLTGSGVISIAHSNALGGGTLYLRSTQAGTATTFGVSNGITVTNAIEMDSTTGREAISNNSGNNTLSGGITITGSGTNHLILQNAGASGDTFAVSGGISGATYAGSVSIRGNAGTINTLSGAINIASELQHNGAADWTLNTAGSSYTITKMVNSGSIILGANDALATSAKVIWNVGTTGKIDLGGFNQTVAGLDAAAITAANVTNNGGADKTLTLSGLSADYTYAGTITNGTTNKVALTMNSAGRTQTLTGTNNFTGGTRIDAGTITLGHLTNTLADGGAVNINGGELALGTNTDTVGAVTLTSGSITGSGAGKLTGTGSNFDVRSGTISAKLGGTVGLDKTTGGTVTISSDNSSGGYSGATTVTDGKLVINGNISTSSLTTVKTGATLGGAGTVGALTIDSGGTLAPGNSPGIFSTGDYNQAGTLSLELNGTTAGTAYDQVSVTGSVTLSGTLAATVGYTPVNGDLLFILLNDSTDAISGTFGGLAQGATVTFSGYAWQISYNADSTANTFTGTENGNDIALMAVPEPNVAALLGGLGTLLLLRRRRSA